MSTEDGIELPPLDRDERTQVCVVGAGISGLTTAYLLCQAGVGVIVVDDGPIADGETGRTTAHLTNALDDRYYELERLHGEEGAKLAAESHTAAIGLIESIVRQESLDCDFVRLDGYLFVPPGEPTDILAREHDAARRVGLVGVERVDRAPMDVDTGLALRFPNQAQFHPQRYLRGLARAVVRDGGRLARGHVVGVETKNGHRVRTARGSTVEAGAIVIATNTPVNDRFAIHTKQAAYRTFVIGALVPKGSVPLALFWDTADPYHYVRLTEGLDAGHDVLIVGGEDHKTGQADDGSERFAALERWARTRYPAMREVRWRWSGQVMEPVDGLGFIGRNPGDERIFVITGDSGNGMTHGTIGGRIVSSLILERDNPWVSLYDPARMTLRAAAEYAKENVNVARQYVDLVTGGERAAVDQVQPGEGVVMRRGISKYAVYRDPSGEGLTVHSALCTHLGCVVSWNSTEKSWDCPCHGSRFAADGRVINGPAMAALEAADLHDVAEAEEVEREPRPSIRPEVRRPPREERESPGA